MLHKGMGRAVLYLLGQDLSQYREMILDCCVHDYDYGPADHAEYLYPLIKASSEQDYYRDEMIRLLMTTQEDIDYGRLLDLAVLFARGGDDGAREAIYGKLKRSLSDDRLPGAREAIDLDGVDGLIRVLGIIGPAASDHRPTDIELLVERTAKVSSLEAVDAAVCDSSSTDANVAATLAAVGLTSDSVVEDAAARLKKWRSGIGAKVPKNLTWEELKERRGFVQLTMAWSRVATDTQFEEAARDFYSGDDDKRLHAYLKLFWMRPFPLEPKPLISLVDHPNDRVALAALSALENLSHPRVREVFERLRDSDRWSNRAAGLLQHNYHAGDDQIILGMLERETDPDKLHLLAMDTRQVYKENPLPEGIEPMLLAYEKTPCSMCRNGCVEGLETLRAVPDWMIEECLYDADSSTRELAARLKSATCTEPPE